MFENSWPVSVNSSVSLQSGAQAVRARIFSVFVTVRKVHRRKRVTNGPNKTGIV